MSQPANTASLDGCRALVVEDEFLIADDISTALRQLGADIVGPFGSLDQALEASEGQIDFAVLDINLHDETVYELADRLIARSVPIVFATGYGAASIPERYQAIPCWEKPFDEVKMALSVSEALRG